MLLPVWLWQAQLEQITTRQTEEDCCVINDETCLNTNSSKDLIFFTKKILEQPGGILCYWNKFMSHLQDIYKALLHDP